MMYTENLVKKSKHKMKEIDNIVIVFFSSGSNMSLNYCRITFYTDD